MPCAQNSCGSNSKEFEPHFDVVLPREVHVGGGTYLLRWRGLGMCGASRMRMSFCFCLN